MTNIIRYCRHPNELRNFGDKLNPIIYKMLAGTDPLCVDTATFLQKDHYMCIGSILESANKYSLVWGAGFMFQGSTLKEKPKKVYAVRGPLTRIKLLRQGIKCPEIYGDPAIIYSTHYRPNRESKYKIGIIKHRVDQDVKIGIEERNDVLNINILDDINVVINNVSLCEHIVASSLHGLILADMYGLPSCRIKLSDKVCGKDFKFHDYYASIDKKNICLTTPSTVERIIDAMQPPRLTSIKDLLKSCPFKSRI